MTKYDIIFESLQDKVDSGELTFEEATVLNELAYEKYSDDIEEYEEITEAYYDKNIKELKFAMNNVKNSIEKEISSIDKEIANLEYKKKKLETKLELKMRPYEKKIDHYEQLNITDPDGRKHKKRKLVASGVVGAAAGVAGAMTVSNHIKDSKKKKIEEQPATEEK